MPEYTHRDRRAQREVDRAVYAVLGVAAGLIGLAMALPVEFVGLLAVVGLGVLGLASLGWSDRLLAQYASDLRHAQDERSPRGFVRAEVGAPVGLDRESEVPPSPSPHVRRRPRAGHHEEREGALPSVSDSDQL